MTRTLFKRAKVAGFSAVCACSNPGYTAEVEPTAHRDPSAGRSPGSVGARPSSLAEAASGEATSGGTIGRVGSAATGAKPVSAPPATPRAQVPAPDVAPFGAREVWQGYSFIVPPTMTGGENAGGYVMSVPGDANAGQGNCAIALFPEAPATGDLVTQAIGLSNELAGQLYGGTLRDGGRGAVYPPSRGVSGAGWRYALVQDDVLTAEGYPTQSRLRVLLIHLGTTVATIVGIESANNHCLDEREAKNLSWQWLFYSLDFPAFTEQNPNLLASQVVGAWHIGGSTSGLQEIYAANGRYADTTTLQRYQQYSATEVLQTTTSFSGQGGFSVSGDQLSRLPDSGRAQTGLFRILEQKNEFAPGGWLPRLYQLQVDLDGNVSEYNLVRRWD